MIYLAGPFFTDEELSIIRTVEDILKRKGLEFYSPRLHEDREHEFQTPKWSRTTFEMDREGIDNCDAVVMVYGGNYSDSGTAWECGYAFAKGKPVIAVHTGVSSNIMIHESVRANIKLEDLETYDFHKLEEKGYTGKMF